MNITKAIFHRCTLVGGLAVALLTGCATTPRAEVPGTLHMHVSLPPTADLLIEDRVTMAFTDVARDVFHQQGFDRPVEEARFASFDELDLIPYLLTINLHEWRVNRIGNIECTFTASLQTPTGTRNLGVFTNTELRGFGSGGFGRWGLARTFEDAAEGALENLARDLARTELLPDFRGTARDPIAS